MSITRVTPKRRLVQKLGYGLGSSTAVNEGGRPPSRTGTSIRTTASSGRSGSRPRPSPPHARRPPPATRRRTGASWLPRRQRTVGQVADEFFALQDSLVQSGELRPRTVELYKQRWRSHLAERLGTASSRR